MLVTEFRNRVGKYFRLSSQPAAESLHRTMLLPLQYQYSKVDTISENELTIPAMSSYSDYIMSASSSIADIVSTAGTAAASAAGQVAGQVSQS